MAETRTPASLEIRPEQATLVCVGTWTVQETADLYHAFPTLIWPESDHLTLDGSQIDTLDTTGVWLLHQIIAALKERHHTLTLQGFQPDHQALLEWAEKEARDISHIPLPPRVTFLENLGKKTVAFIYHTLRFMNFLGEILVHALRWIIFPIRIQWKALWKTVETAGYNALPIIGLLSFLIGIVLAYQASSQLRAYGANVYIVNLIGISLLREFSPLMTSIIIAGRSGAAITANLGSLRINQEIDALQTFGISPIERLALQNFFGLIIVLPLLVVWSDITGVLGGLLMSRKMLDISYTDFITRFQEVIALKHYMLGLIKTPVFAMIIACVGCYQGFQVESSAESVGSRTTRSVVQAIFYIIVADALFSVLFNWYGL